MNINNYLLKMSNKNQIRSEFIAKFLEKNKINIDNENI